MAESLGSVIVAHDLSLWNDSNTAVQEQASKYEYKAVTGTRRARKIFECFGVY